MKSFRIKQGDAYAIPVTVLRDGEEIEIGDIERAEFMLGRGIRHTWPEDVAYEDGAFLFPLTQEETLSLTPALTLPLDVRVKFTGGDVIGVQKAAQATIVDALSAEEL